MTENRSPIPEDEARAVWQRAIELQRRAERRGQAESAPPAPSGGFTVDQILAAAEGAGIDPAYVQMSLAERRLPDADQVRPDRRAARWHRAVVGSTGAIEASYPIPASPARALAAFEAVTARPAFQLVLEDRVGPDPPADGVLVYRIERSSTFASSSFHSAMTVADARVLLLTARDEGDHTLLRVRLPQFEQGVNLAITAGLAGGLGTAGGVGGAAAGGAFTWLTGAGAAAILAPVAGGALLGGALGVAGFRRLHRWGSRRGERAVRRLLQAVAAEAAMER